MRGLLGILILVLGVAGLGYWGSKEHARNMEETITNGANAVIGETTHTTDIAVIGRDITVTGLADSEAERDEIIARLDGIEGRRVVRDEMTILEAASPFIFAAEKSEAGVAISGNVPREVTRAEIASANVKGASDLILASGAPDGWQDATGVILNALSPLEDGTAKLMDKSLTLMGTALTPAERDEALAALENMPEGYDIATDFTLIDDGKPAAFDLVWRAAEGARAEGKLPAGLTREKMAEALGVAEVAGEAAPGIPGADQAGAVLETMTGMRDWLPQLDFARYGFNHQDANLEAQLTPGADPELIGEALNDVMGGSAVSITEAEEQPDLGATRVNVITRETERYLSGYWLPEIDFVPDLNSCETQANDALARAKIEFVTGSARLGPKAVSAINRVAAVMRACINNAGLNAELGGHTDNTGDANANYVLSGERAEAVRQALIARAVPPNKMISVGYGDTEPVADNSTEDGRAENRRTTIRWYQYN